MVRKTFFERIKEIDRKLDFIRLPENVVTVEGKPLTEWIKEVGGKDIEVEKYYLLIREK